MKKKFNGVLTLLLAFFVQISFAQEKTVSGVVSDETGPLPGVSILKKGTSQGVETDFNGKYSIKAKKGDVLVFSFVGMQTVEKKILNTSKINVILKESRENVLDAVVVTGMGIKRDKKSLGFSQQSVGGEQLTKSKEVDVNNALAGKVSGVQIVGNNSSSFGNSQIKLRGSDNVLYVVDGVKLYSSSDINPDNIADISILKGAAGTAIYGPEGRNGVVIVTTKSAKSGKSIFSIDHSTTVNTIRNLPEFQNEYGGGYQQEWKTFKYDASKDPASWAKFDGHKLPEYNADESWGPKLDGTLVRHWDSWIPSTSEFGKLRAWSPTANDVDSFYRPAITNNTTFSFAKAGENYKVRTGLTYVDQGSVMKNSDRQNIRASVNASYKISDKFEFYTNINYEDRKTKNNPEQNYGNVGSNTNQWWQRQLDFNRLSKYEFNGTVYSWNIKSPRKIAPLYWDMPYFHAYENLKFSTKNSFIGKVGGKYDFTDKLSLKGEVRKTYNNYTFNDRNTTKSNLEPSSYLERRTFAKRDEFFGIATYKDKTESFDYNFNIGGELAHYTYNRMNAETVGGLTIPGFYNLANAKDKVDTRITERQFKNRGLFFTGSLGYQNMLYIDGSYRIDWNSAANPEDNSLHTWGLSASYLLHKVIPKNDVLTFAKVRVGHALAPFFPEPYRISSTYTPGLAYQGKPTLSVSTTQGNPDLKGGIRSETEFGTELSFVKNRISMDLTYYIRKDKDIPMPQPLDGATGFTEINLNGGQYTTKGIEFGLSGDVIKTEDLRFNVGVNFGTIQKNVDKLGGTDSRQLSSYTARMRLLEKKGEEWGAIYGSGYALDKNGNRIIRENKGKYYYAEHKNKFLGNLLPDFTGGITASLNYKNFGLDLGFDFQQGGKYYSRTERYYNHSGLAPYTAGKNDKGNLLRDPVANGGGMHIKGVLQTGTNDKGVPVSDGTVVDTYVNPQDWYNLGNLGNIYENNLHDASYFKLRTIKLNYQFDKELVKKFKLDGASIGVFANNLWLISSEIDWIDPSELEKRNQINWAENGTLPSTRNLGVNLKLTF